jgi:hypothetical protein
MRPLHELGVNESIILKLISDAFGVKGVEWIHLLRIGSSSGFS